jgi:hypothetical protein
MLLSNAQLTHMAQHLFQARALHWQTQVDRALPPARQADPQARLEALTQVVLDDLPAGDEFQAIEVTLASRWLTAALQAGAPWREARANALLHAAAALGAQWCQDDRLLPVAEQVPLQPDRFDTLLPLLAQPQGQRFKRAALREHALAPGLRMALHRCLQADCSDVALQHLVWVAFAPEDEAAGADAEADDTPDQDADTPPWPPEAQRFIDHERRLQAEAGVREPALARLSLAGDLVLGLGRCVRLLSRWAAAQPARTTPPIDTLREALHAATRLQR